MARVQHALAGHLEKPAARRSVRPHLRNLLDLLPEPIVPEVSRQGRRRPDGGGWGHGRGHGRRRGRPDPRALRGRGRGGGGGHSAGRRTVGGPGLARHGGCRPLAQHDVPQLCRRGAPRSSARRNRSGGDGCGPRGPGRRGRGGLTGWGLWGCRRHGGGWRCLRGCPGAQGLRGRGGPRRRGGGARAGAEVRPGAPSSGADVAHGRRGRGRVGGAQRGLCGGRWEADGDPRTGLVLQARGTCVVAEDF